MATIADIELDDTRRSRPPLLTSTEAGVLSRARRVLRDLERRAEDRQSSRCGRVAEAASQAEEGVFQALNVASVYGDDPSAAMAIRADRPEHE